MIVCHCLGLTDREIRDAACRGSRARNGSISGTPAASACGGCREVVLEILSENSQSPAAASSDSAPLARSQ